MKRDIFADEQRLAIFRCPECGKRFMTMPGVKICPYCNAMGVEVLQDKNKERHEQG